MNLEKLKSIGEAFEYKNFIVFFGNKRATLNALTAYIPGSHILKQVHGDKLVKCSDGIRYTEQEADAHWVSSKNRSLLIKTADCLPIMICAPQKNIALAIHAGWRGVEKKITSKAITELQLQGDSKLKVFIGPHIQKHSFQVDKDVANSILTAHGLALTSPKVVDEMNGKFHIDLSFLILKELEELGIDTDKINLSTRDTKTDETYYSYRRGDKGVRNYAFILKLK